MTQLTRFSSHLRHLGKKRCSVLVPVVLSFVASHSCQVIRPTFKESRNISQDLSHPEYTCRYNIPKDGICPHVPTAMDACAEVLLIPTFSDNYAYLLIDESTKDAACVDPAEPEKVVKVARERGVNLKLCLCTHKHIDHSGGNQRIRELVPDIVVCGSAYEDTPGVVQSVRDGDVIKLGGLKIKVLHTPCHTVGHVLYFVESTHNPNTRSLLFSGDTLFAGGCGRFFEGDAKMMHRALMGIVAKMPNDTLVYCGHEYTLGNLAFASSVDPDNPVLASKHEWAKARRQSGKPTIPTTIGEELAYNPFMRVDKRPIQEKVGAPVGDEIQTMHLLRSLKNSFRG